MPPSPTARRRRPCRLRPLVAVLLLGSTLVLATTLSTRPAEASAHDFSDPIFSADARGDITTVGNVTTICDPTYSNQNWSAAESAAACLGATAGEVGLVRYDGAPMPPINNRLSMRYVDIDEDATTFASSSARLAVPAGATVLWAGLHWNAATDVPEAAQLYGSTFRAPPVDAADRFQVRMATPASGGYVSLDAQPANGTTRDTWDDVNPGGTVSYGGFVDVTDLVSVGGSGDYRVANVQACTGFGGCFGSWSLTVAFADEAEPPRNLNVWHGWQLTTPTVNGGAQEFTANGIAPPPSGPVNARIGVVQADGDRGLGPDSLDISSPSSPSWTPFTTVDRPLNASEGDWFNSTVNSFGQRRPASAANPNLLANLNHDIALVEENQVIGNDDTAFSFRIKTAGTESLYSQVVHSAVDLYEPEIAIDKTVDAAGPVEAGSEVTWRLDVRNVGIDPIRRAVVTDPLPAGLTLVPGSVRYYSGGPADLLGTKTDAPGDDQFDWDNGNRLLTLRIGAGATAAQGGTMGIAPADDGSDQIVITFRTTVDAPPEALVENVATATGEGRELDDPFGPLTTADEDSAEVATVPVADLGITKTDGDAIVRRLGDRFTYGLEATNAGPSAATGVIISDALDPGVRFVDSSDSCAAVGQDVTCPVGDLAAGEAAIRSFVVEVVELPGPGEVIPNVASIDGDQPNPDCVDLTPDALCNTDDEETPQPSIDLGIVKSDGDAVVEQVGDTYTYELEVINAGPDDATAVTITDELDPMLAFVSSEACAADGQTVTCAIGDLAADQTATVQLVVEVVKLPAEGGEIPNVAVVTAAEPDPDCGELTPDALCNTDEEQTPWVPTVVLDTPTTVPVTSPAPTSPAPRTTGGSPLPRTGRDLTAVAVAGLALIGSGTAAMTVRRRRRSAG